MRPRTASCSTQPHGRSTAADATSVAATAWPIAATSRRRWSPPQPRSASRCARRLTRFALAETSPTSTEVNPTGAAPGEGEVFLTGASGFVGTHVLDALLE